jgi:release factor glutamine methyltransferase
MKISEYKTIITAQLAKHSDTPQLDAELLLMHALKKTRTQLFVSLHEELTDTHTADSLVNRRMNGEPIAYILGHQPFWTMDLLVTQETLIPRPETECMVEWVLHHFANQKNNTAADLGTGSGAIALTLACENPSWIIHATDQSPGALSIAKQNAEKYSIKNISFYLGDWFDALPEKKYHLIVSNPPYIADNDRHLDKLTFEPLSALASGKNGLDAITKIIKQARHFLLPNGYLAIEHGYDQADAVCALFASAGFSDIKNHRDLSGVSRFVTGKSEINI